MYVQSYFIPRNIQYPYVKYFYFPEMKFFIFSKIGNPECSFHSSFSLFFSSNLYHHFMWCWALPSPLTYPILPSFSIHMNHLYPTQQLVNKKLTLVFLCVAGRGEGSRLEEIKTFKFLCSSKGTRTSIWNIRQRCESIHKKNWDL